MINRDMRFRKLEFELLAMQDKFFSRLLVNLLAGIYFVAQVSKCLADFIHSTCAVDVLRWIF